MATVVKAGSRHTFRCEFRDQFGNLTSVDPSTPGVPSVDDPAKASFENVAADGLSGEVVFGTATATGQVAVRVDADRGEGVRELIVLGDFEIVPDDAVAGAVVLGA